MKIKPDHIPHNSRLSSERGGTGGINLAYDVIGKSFSTEQRD